MPVHLGLYIIIKIGDTVMSDLSFLNTKPTFNATDIEPLTNNIDYSLIHRFYFNRLLSAIREMNLNNIEYKVWR
jgi:hypothetical protein